MPLSRVVLAILAKDLEDAARSYTLWLFLLCPIVLSLLFARALSDKDLRKPTLAVYDAAGSGLMVQLHKQSESLQIQEVHSPLEGLEMVERGLAPVALCLYSPDFDQQLLAGKYPRLELVVDEGSRQVFVVRECIKSAVRELAGQELPADIRVERKLHQHESRLALVPVWVLFAVISGMLVASSSIIEERDSGTLEQVLCGPARLGEVLAGKMSASWLLSFAAGILVLALNHGLEGSWQPLVLLVAVGSLTAVGTGTLVGLWSPSQAAANTLAGLLFVVLLVPTEMADWSVWLHRLAIWSPAYYLRDGIYRALVEGAGIGDLTVDFLVLAATSVGVFILGIWQMRRVPR